MRMPRWTGWIVWSAVIVLAIIGLAAVTRRALDLAQVIPPAPYPRGGAFDAGFARQPILTFLHIIPGAIFMVLGPLQFVQRIRTRHIRLHRLSGWLFVATSTVIGVTALIMSVTVTIGGGIETAATVVFAVLFLVCLTRAVLHIRRREIAQHREWMLRTFAIGLAVATIRPIIGLFFALTTLVPQEFFGIAFWIGFTLHLVLAEIWIRLTRLSMGGQIASRANPTAPTGSYTASRTAYGQPWRARAVPRKGDESP